MTASIPPRRRKWSCGCLLIVLLIISPCCYMGLYLFGSEISGMVVEHLTHYRNSNLIYSGYGLYGSSEFQIKSYVRWTPDDVAEVQDYYDRFPKSWRPEILPVEGIDYSDMVIVCSWVGFAMTTACETVKNSVPNNGTLIIFNHSYWAG